MTQTPNATSPARRTMTEQEATDEAVLLLIRKTMRLHPEAYADVIKRLPDGARHALMLAENRADRLRDKVSINLLDYPADIEDEDDSEEQAEAAMTADELEAWLRLRGVDDEALPGAVARNYGKTEAAMNEEYSKICGRMA